MPLLPAAIITIMAEAIPLLAGDAATDSAGRLLKLMTFLSPAFPVGSFSYSQGLEWLIAGGDVASGDDARHWLVDSLEIGSAWNDAVLLREAQAAAEASDLVRLTAAAELAEALPASRERHLETVAQGRAFLDAVSAAWSGNAWRALRTIKSVPYPVAVGAVAADHGIEAEAALTAYLNALASTLISVGVRLIPIGQAEGLRVLASLHAVIATTVRRALCSTLDDLGSATILAEVASMRHETQYSRVFRT